MEERPQKFKFLVLGVLFLLPITVYLFFASGVNNFGKLPVVTENVVEISAFNDLEGNTVQLEERITVLGFFGEDLIDNQAYAYNLAHKIYKKNHQFEEFQFVILLPESARNQALILKTKIEEIAPTTSWRFAFGDASEITRVFNSLGSNLTLNNNNASPYVFIIDKERNVRGRDDDDDAEDGILYGFDSSIIAEINNKMSDDVKVLLAEYRDARKDKSKRKI
jgi:hypothetical protein